MATIGDFVQRVRVDHLIVTGRDPLLKTDITSWVPFKTIWADVRDELPSRTDSATLATLPVPRSRTRVRYRFDPTITGKMRMVLLGRGGKTMTIISAPADVVKDGRYRVQEVLCEAEE